MAAQHDRSGNLHIAGFCVDLSPIIQKGIFQHHAFWQEEGESGSLIPHHEQAQLFSQLSVVTLFGLLDPCQMFLQVCLLSKCRAVDPGEHFIFLAASPVGTCKACELECLHRFCSHEMGACAQVCKFSLSVEADHSILWQVFDQFYFVRLLLFFHESNGFLSRKFKAFQGQAFLHDLLHFRFNLFQILRCQGDFSVNIIIEAVGNGWSDCQLGIRIQALDRLGHDMGCSVAECCLASLILKGQNAQLTVAVHNCSQIHCLSVHFSGTSHSCQTFADIRSDINHRHGMIIFFL